MSFSSIDAHLPKEGKTLYSYKDYKEYIQYWWRATLNSKSFHQFKLTEIQTKPESLALKIFKGTSFVNDIVIKDACGKYEYHKNVDGDEEFYLYLHGIDSLFKDFELKFRVKVKDKNISEQKLVINRFLQNGDTQAIC